MQVLFTLAQALCLWAPFAAAIYTLQDDYGTSAAFFDKFTFFTASDPTHGFVKYVDRSTAENTGLINAGGSIYMGVDHTNVASGGRQSVRISSNNAYNHGLFILDLAHMPGSICGVWPAFWLLGPNWPNGGEIDVIEGVNEQAINQVALHTSDNCTINNSGFSGTLLTSNCYVNAPGQDNNAGCGIKDNSAQSYGNGFNNAGGGVYATEWTGEAISIWFFPRASIPGDIMSGNPNPSAWGIPSARFAGACNIDSHFNNLQIVFDTTFCGDWAGGIWGRGSCASKGSCNDWVANNPSAFADAYWRLNSLKVYQGGASAGNRTTWKRHERRTRPSFLKPRRGH
ncbi:concanavalin A-like lectin/glucanase domain-containing protein [Aspergillus coremiiformis]|uniref:endo-1,3(4)-beta-glucanase n=1 Tax=Aspergillus coremiiformis TaxID=138285 RepID=A0A5N6Z2F5_9EURO|nr:concanavalin A-like lectin/glucanase domain-containing protein [Aspergillus coremiiformis]